MLELDHKHIIVNAIVWNPPREGDERKVEDWLTRMVNAVGMKLVCGPFAKYCKADENEGITAACCIETSHASMHVWDKLLPPILRFDLYSCAAFQQETITRMLEEFEPSQIDYIVLDRNTDITVMDRETILLPKYLPQTAL